jgi:hypothetical protein
MDCSTTFFARTVFVGSCVRARDGVLEWRVLIYILFGYLGNIYPLPLITPQWIRLFMSAVHRLG